MNETKVIIFVVFVQESLVAISNFQHGPGDEEHLRESLPRNEQGRKRILDPHAGLARQRLQTDLVMTAQDKIAQTTLVIRGLGFNYLQSRKHGKTTNNKLKITYLSLI